MKEKILELLKTKFLGVSEQTLSRIAEKAAKTVTDDEAATTYVESVSFQSLIDSEADYRATRATQTSIENYEKKHGIKEGKPIKKDEPPKGEDEPEQKKDEVPEWAKGILAMAQQFQEKSKEELLKQKKAQLVEKLIELGADKNDKEKLSQLTEISGIGESDDLESKAQTILGIYNTFKKPIEGSGGPEKTEIEKDIKGFEDLLKSAVE